MTRDIRAPRGAEITCLGWPQEAAMRMLMNNLDPDVAEKPSELVVYGGIGKAARDWPSFDRIVAEHERGPLRRVVAERATSLREAVTGRASSVREAMAERVGAGDGDDGQGDSAGGHTG